MSVKLNLNPQASVVYERLSEWVRSSPAGLHLCAGGSASNWHVCNRNHTEIIVLAYVSQRDAACRAPLRAYMHLRCTEHQKRVIVGVQGHSGSSGKAGAVSRKSNAFSGLHILPRWLGKRIPLITLLTLEKYR